MPPESESLGSALLRGILAAMLFVFAPFAAFMSIVLLVENWNSRKDRAMREREKRLAEERFNFVGRGCNNIALGVDSMDRGKRLSPETRWSSVRTESVFSTNLVDGRTRRGI